MSAAEFGRWIKYRNTYGAMDDNRMVDRPAALIACVLSRVNGGKAEIEDFMLHKKEEDEPVISNPVELASVFGGLKR